MLDEATKTRLRQQLEDERQRLQADIATARQETREMTADEVEENPMSNHYDDLGTDLQEIDRIAAVNENSLEMLEKVEHALRRMDEGSYGLSEVSGKEIPLERLEALPYATRLVGEETETIDRSKIDSL